MHKDHRQKSATQNYQNVMVSITDLQHAKDSNLIHFLPSFRHDPDKEHVQAADGDVATWFKSHMKPRLHFLDLSWVRYIAKIPYYVNETNILWCKKP